MADAAAAPGGAAECLWANELMAASSKPPGWAGVSGEACGGGWAAPRPRPLGSHFFGALPAGCFDIIPTIFFLFACSLFILSILAIFFFFWGGGGV